EQFVDAAALVEMAAVTDDAAIDGQVEPPPCFVAIKGRCELPQIDAVVSHDGLLGRQAPLHIPLRERVADSDEATERRPGGRPSQACGQATAEPPYFGQQSVRLKRHWNSRA